METDSIINNDVTSQVKHIAGACVNKNVHVHAPSLYPYMCTCTHMYIHIYMYVHMCIHICTYMYVYMYCSNDSAVLMKFM